MHLSEVRQRRARPRRAVLREKTRARLMAVGRVAFAQKGLAATNLTDDILAPAGVSVGSFYHQFADKTDLFLAILREHSESLRALVHGVVTLAPGRDPAQVARDSFAAVFAVVDREGDVFRMLAREAESHDPRVRSYLRENHAAWVEALAEDYLASGLLPLPERAVAERLAELVLTFTIGAVRRYLDWSEAERKRRRERWIEELVCFCLGGMSAWLASLHTDARGNS